MVKGYEDDTKSKASKARMPLDPIVLSVLEAWRKIAPYTRQDDYVFASTELEGKKEPLSYPLRPLGPLR